MGWLTRYRQARLMAIIAFGVVVFLGICFSNRAPTHHSIPQPATISATPASHVDKLPKFAGSDRCVECHSEIATKYLLSGMGKSLTEVGSETAIEDYDQQNSFSPDGRHHYTVVRTDEGVFHHERLEDDTGETIYDQSVKIDYVVGSGIQGRSYLFNRNGMLYMSPIGWYSSAGKWDLSPGFSLPVHRRFSRRVPVACVECHAGQMNLTSREDVFEDAPFREMPIGCERCHGSGLAHIQFRRREKEFDSDPIINPARLDPIRRDDVCSQCHLSGEGRFLRDGCHFGEFVPGTRLEETYLIFVQGNRTTADGKTRAVSQVEQMRASRCYNASGGRMGCISCHDPHSSTPEQDQSLFYRKRCLSCHEEQGCALDESERRSRQVDDSCIVCHMPDLDASDVPHTAQTDHRIVRVPDRFSSQESHLSDRPELYDGAETRLPETIVARARGLWLSERAERFGNQKIALQAVRILERVVRDRPEDVEVLEALGTCSAISGQLQDSRNYCNRVLALRADREQTLLTAASLELKQGSTDAGRQLLEKYLAVQPNDAAAWGRYSGVLSQLDLIDHAIEAAQKSIEIDPANTRTYSHLAELFHRTGNSEKEQIYRDLGRRVQSAKFPP